MSQANAQANAVILKAIGALIASGFCLPILLPIANVLESLRLSLGLKYSMTVATVLPLVVAWLGVAALMFLVLVKWNSLRKICSRSKDNSFQDLK